MFSRKALLISLALASAIASGISNAAAQTYVDAETGQTRAEFIPGWMKSMMPSRAEVVAGISQFRMNGVSGDGRYRFVGGESGWELISPTYESVNGQRVRTDRIERTAMRHRVTLAEAQEEALRVRRFNPTNE